MAALAGQLYSKRFKRSDDNRVSSRPSGLTGSSQFGLGMDGANNPIGYYNIAVVQSTMTADGAPGKYKASDDGGASWFTFSTPTPVLLSYDLNPRLGAIDLQTAANGSQPTPITSASTELQVTAFIQPEDSLDNSAEITLDGSATIELVYL